MGKRIRLAQALADGTLDGEELALAKGNRIIVQMANDIKSLNKKKTLRRVKKNGR